MNRYRLLTNKKGIQQDDQGRFFVEGITTDEFEATLIHQGKILIPTLLADAVATTWNNGRGRPPLSITEHYKTLAIVGIMGCDPNIDNILTAYLELKGDGADRETARRRIKQAEDAIQHKSALCWVEDEPDKPLILHRWFVIFIGAYDHVMVHNLDDKRRNHLMTPELKVQTVKGIRLPHYPLKPHL